MQLERDVARGVHRIEDANTNWYLVEDDGRVCVVDAGVPSSWDSLHEALRAFGRTPADVAAVVLTHAHFDHVGFAEKARSQLGVPVYVHENDVPLTRHPWRYDFVDASVRNPEGLRREGARLVEERGADIDRVVAALTPVGS